MTIESQKRSNPWVLVTGASRGIGELLAERFAQESWNVVLVARSKERLEALSERLKAKYQVKAEVVAADLSDMSAPQQIYDDLKARGIVLEGLVNNAGLGFGRVFHESALEGYLGMIDVNIKALVSLTHLFLGSMVKRGSGLVINVSSTASYLPIPETSVYAASKSFVTSFTEALWLEVKGTGVRVLNVCPGLTKTNFGLAAGLRDFREVKYAAEPAQVVEHVFNALKTTQPTVISGWFNQWMVRMIHMTPHWVVLNLVRLFRLSKKNI